MVASAEPIGLLPTGYLHLAGYTTEYVSLGNGEPVVVVPGLAGGIGLAEPFLKQLARHYRVYCYQLRGEGFDLLERGFGFGQFVRDLDQVIGALRLERPGLVGLGFGGAVAFDYAAGAAHRLAFLAVQGAGRDYRPSLLAKVAREVVNRLALPNDSPLINQFFRLLIGSDDPCHLEFVLRHWWRTDQSVVAHRLCLLDEYTIEGRLSLLGLPILLSGGEHDAIVSTESLKELARLLPAGRFCPLDAAGHLAFVTHARKLADRIHRFSVATEPVRS